MFSIFVSLERFHFCFVSICSPLTVNNFCLKFLEIKMLYGCHGNAFTHICPNLDQKVPSWNFKIERSLFKLENSFV